MTFFFWLYNANESIYLTQTLYTIIILCLVSKNVKMALGFKVKIMTPWCKMPGGKRHMEPVQLASHQPTICPTIKTYYSLGRATTLSSPGGAG